MSEYAYRAWSSAWPGSQALDAVTAVAAAHCSSVRPRHLPFWFLTRVVVSSALQEENPCLMRLYAFKTIMFWGIQ